MSIAAASISAEALGDMMQLFDSQSWIKPFHEELAELWSLCTLREQQILIKDLLMHFCMFDAELEAKACKQFNEQIHQWELIPRSTWIVAVADANEVDGSSAGLQKLKNKVLPYEDWHARFISNIPESIKKIKNGDSIVLFDDFIGSGKKIVRKDAWLKKLLAGQGIDKTNIFCSCFSGMELGIQHIKDELKIPVFASILLRRGISDRYKEKELETAIRIMKDIEGKLSQTYKKKNIDEFSLGFNQSEALYCATNDNCPNNVFPIFWWPRKKDGTLFRTLLQRAG